MNFEPSFNDINFFKQFGSAPKLLSIRESVDSLCRDGADTQYMQKPYNFATNSLFKHPAFLF